MAARGSQSRGRKRLGRALVFIGVILAVMELYYLYVLVSTLFVPLHAPDGRAAQIHLRLNGSAWALLVGWAAACAGLVFGGVRMMRKHRDS